MNLANLATYAPAGVRSAKVNCSVRLGALEIAQNEKSYVTPAWMGRGGSVYPLAIQCDYQYLDGGGIGPHLVAIVGGWGYQTKAVKTVH